jgi:hypothetical protein
VAVRVTISCALRPVYPGSQVEDIVLRVAAKAPGMKSERFTPTGWKVEGENKAGGNPEPANGIVTVHDRSTQKYFPRAIESLELKWQNYSGAWTLRLTKKTPELFVAWLQSLPPEIEVLLDKELATLRDAPVSGNVSLDVAEAGIDWFDLKVALKVSDTTLTPQELKLLLNARGGYVRLGKRGWRRLQFNLTPEDDEHLARLGLDARDFSADPQRFHALQLADDAAKKFLTPERVENPRRAVAAAGHPRRNAAVSNRRFSFFGLPRVEPFRRRAGRRHGPGQDAANAGLAGLAEGNDAQRSTPNSQPVTGRLSQIRHGQLARRSRTVLSKLARPLVARRTGRETFRRARKFRPPRHQLRATALTFARHRKYAMARSDFG